MKSEKKHKGLKIFLSITLSLVALIIAVFSGFIVKGKMSMFCPTFRGMDMKKDSTTQKSLKTETLSN